MKTLATVLFAAGCALAQSADNNIPRLLADRGILSAIPVEGDYERFRRAAANIPIAADAMEKALAGARSRKNKDVGADIKNFQAARFDLQCFHDRAADALEALRTELALKSFASGEQFPLTSDEYTAAGKWWDTARKDLDRAFVTAETRWRKTWRRAEKFVGH